MPKKCVGGPRLRPDPTGGAHDVPPDLLVGWGGGHQSQCSTHDPRALRGNMVPPADLELATVLFGA